MDVLKAKQLVVDAGVKLVETGLIARTWGNVSCRISDTQFVISPSGRTYETLTVNDIVLVNIEDLSYDGDIKPSSEKGIHAEAYKHRSDIHFVIHTHQINASAVSALDMHIPIKDENTRKLIGDKVLCASYGLPSTKKLRKGIINALKKSNSKGIIMSHHGALCMGTEFEDAFMVAYKLEEVCDQFIINEYIKRTQKPYDKGEMLQYIGTQMKKDFTMDVTKGLEISGSERGDNGEFIFWKGKNLIRINIKTGAIMSGTNDSVSLESEIHRAIYASREDIRYISSSTDEDVKAISSGEVVLKPYLDDLAQIVGTSVKYVQEDNQEMSEVVKNVVYALKGRHAVMIAGMGALCCGTNKAEADAIELVLKKGSKAFMAAKLFETAHPIHPLECKLMRFIYQKKYSKMAKK